MKNFTDKEFDRYLEVRRLLDGYKGNVGLRVDLYFAHQKMRENEKLYPAEFSSDNLFDEISNHSSDHERYCDLLSEVTSLSKEVKELENKIIFNSEITE